jgi:hypothetical protein
MLFGIRHQKKGFFWGSVLQNHRVVFKIDALIWSHPVKSFND